MCSPSSDVPSLHIDLVCVPPVTSPVHQPARRPTPEGQRKLTADDLREALRLGQLEVHYQPVVDLRRAEVVGVEALVRWRHPEAGLLMPEHFLPLAEASGLIGELGAWVLDTACRQGAYWQRQGLPLEISVNVSVRNVTADDFLEVVRRALETSGLQPRRLLVEVTESAVTEDIDTVAAALSQLDAMGVSMAIDDFGTGYSSLTQLKRYPVGALKLDGSFVAGLGWNSDDAAIVSSIIKLAGAVGALCIAECVETRAQHLQLLEAGCDRAQGLLFSAPVTAPQLAAAIDLAEASAAHPVTEAPRREPRKPAPLVPQDVMEHMLAMHEAGASSPTIAAALNQMGSLHPRGTRWHRTSVARCIGDALRVAQSGRR